MHYYSLVIMWYYWGNKVDTSKILEIQSIVRIVIMGQKQEVLILKQMYTYEAKPINNSIVRITI